VKVIQYDETLKEYNGALLNTLRGFTPKYEFIASWVPDADLLRSVISLAEAAFSEDEFQFTLTFSKETMLPINRNEFDLRLADIAIFTSEETSAEVNYHFSDMKSKDSKLSFQKNQVFNPNNNDNKESIQELSEVNGDEIYLSQINHFCEQTKHNRKLTEVDSLTLIALSDDKITLQVQVDEENVVRQLAYQGELSLTQTGILEAACQLLVNLPIDDIRDNGLVLIEYHLRKNCKQRKMAGIQVHFNFSEIFTPLKMLLTGLVKQLASKKVNFFDIRNQLTWDVSQRDDIKQQLIEHINQYLSDKNKSIEIEVENVDEKARVTIMLGDEISANEKGQLLMDLEIIVRKNIHPAIQLYSTLYVDRNTKRKGHQWAINL
jgi:NifU-like protein involved in Fe-S cluster formation